jgi:hypothetical protein
MPSSSLWAGPLGLASLFTEGVAEVLGLYEMATTPTIERGGLTGAIAGSDREVSPSR